MNVRSPRRALCGSRFEIALRCTVRGGFLVLSLLTAVVALTPAASAADSHARIEGSGSSWAENAINQWVSDVTSDGLQVVFTGTGSQAGRQDYAQSTTDFGISDIGYQGTNAEVQGDVSNRPYVYLPIVAGGTSFPYNITVAGKQINNLRLSGLTLAKIFTNGITNWDDPAITADNNGHALPSLPIIPVVHSEGSGSTYQFTAYLTKQFPQLWAPFNKNIAAPTEFFPQAGDQIAQDGSDGVMNFIRSKSANGAIGFDEYSYGLLSKTPVAKIENSAGYFTLPSQYAVAVALTQAIINDDPTSSDYLLQNLANVYAYSDPRTYPLSSYSYMILPTGTNVDDSRMTTPKRQTLADFMYYSLCEGQKEMGPIGYSPLPINLVTAGFGQLAKLQTADPAVDLTQRNASTCNNPTFIPGQPTKNYLAEIAPQPAACDKTGAGPCGFTVPLTTNPTNAPGSKSSGAPPTVGTAPAKTGGATAPGDTSGSHPATGPLASLESQAAASQGAQNPATCPADPDTGAPEATCAATTTTVAAQLSTAVSSNGPVNPSDAQEVPTTLVADRGGSPKVLGGLAVGELLAALVIPVFIGRRFERRRSRQ